MTDGLHYSLKTSHVHELAIQLLGQLSLEAPGDKVQVTDILNVLVFAAAFRTSIHQACEDLEGAPSGATVLGELARQLDDLEELEVDLNALVAQLLPKGLGSRERRVAVDLVRLPYHGSVPPEHQREVCRSKAAQGTIHFFTYATAYVVLRGHRYTLAICRVCKGDKMIKVLKALMDRLQVLGVKLSLLLLDRGFYSVTGHANPALPRVW